VPDEQGRQKRHRLDRCERREQRGRDERFPSPEPDERVPERRVPVGLRQREEPRRDDEPRAAVAVGDGNVGGVGADDRHFGSVDADLVRERRHAVGDEVGGAVINSASGSRAIRRSTTIGPRSAEPPSPTTTAAIIPENARAGDAEAGGGSEERGGGDQRDGGEQDGDGEKRKHADGPADTRSARRRFGSVGLLRAVSLVAAAGRCHTTVSCHRRGKALPEAIDGVRLLFSGSETVSTGTSATRTIFSVTLPRRYRSRPVSAVRPHHDEVDIAFFRVVQDGSGRCPTQNRCLHRSQTRVFGSMNDVVDGLLPCFL